MQENPFQDVETRGNSSEIAEKHGNRRNNEEIMKFQKNGNLVLC